MIRDAMSRRAVSGPYTKRSLRYLTPREIEIACDGDRATRLMREQVLIHPNGKLSIMVPDIRIPRESKLLGLLNTCKLMIISSLSCGKEGKHGKNKTAKHSAHKEYRRSKRCPA
ncbi:MAG: hypothetical protein Q4F74_04165 [Synergistaceae bacterium]|nr:hypothetical protein [Synergistaceae bacterium]